MSDRSNAEILIAGRLHEDHLDEFVGLLADAGVSFDWGDGRVDPVDLKGSIIVDAGEHRVLRFVCDEAIGGEFEALEAWLIRMKLSFCRTSSECTGAYEASCRLYIAETLIPKLYPAAVDREWDGAATPMLRAPEIRGLLADGELEKELALMEFAQRFENDLKFKFTTEA